MKEHDKNYEIMNIKEIICGTLVMCRRHSIPREAIKTQICWFDYGSPSTTCVADAIHSTRIPGTLI